MSLDINLSSNLKNKDYFIKNSTGNGNILLKKITVKNLNLNELRSTILSVNSISDLNELRKKVTDYQKERRTVLEKITKLRAKARKDLLNKINPIIENYTKENNISFVIDKKTILVGNASLDITSLVIDKLNKELPSLNLK